MATIYLNSRLCLIVAGTLALLTILILSYGHNRTPHRLTGNLDASGVDNSSRLEDVLNGTLGVSTLHFVARLSSTLHRSAYVKSNVSMVSENLRP